MVVSLGVYGLSLTMYMLLHVQQLHMDVPLYGLQWRCGAASTWLAPSYETLRLKPVTQRVIRTNGMSFTKLSFPGLSNDLENDKNWALFVETPMHCHIVYVQKFSCIHMKYVHVSHHLLLALTR